MSLPRRPSWVRRLFGKRRTMPLPPVSFKPQLECLEGRDVPTASFVPAGAAMADTAVTAATTNANEYYVGTLYVNLLGRQGSLQEIQSWSNLLDVGFSRANVANGLLHSAEYRTQVIQGYYQNLLGRPADSVGLQSYLDFMAAGGTFAQVQAQIYGSKEYLQTQTDGTFSGWLGAVYQDQLGRPVDSLGLSAYRQANRDGESRTQIAYDIVSSKESNTLLVQSWYQTYLNRPADQPGLNYWVSQLQSGRKQEYVLAQILGSSEYYSGT